MFVLPRDIYPPPHVSKRAEKREPIPDEEPDDVYRLEPIAPLPISEPERFTPAVPSSFSSDDDVLQAEEVADVEQVPQLPPRKRTRRQRERDRERQKAIEERNRGRERKLPAEPQGPGFLERVGSWFVDVTSGIWTAFRGFWSPLRLVTLALLVIVALIITQGVLRSRQAGAEIAAKENRERGLGFLEEQKWVEARNEFEIAARAVDLLNRHDLEAQQIRQYFRETRAMTRMSAVSLFDLLDKAVDVSKKLGNEEWQRQFGIGHRGSWMTIEGPIIRTVRPADDEKSPPVTRYELLFPWSPSDTVSVRVEASFPMLENLVPPASPIVLILAGELDECLLSEDEHEWVVKFKPDTGFLWAHLETYQGLGFQFDPLNAEEDVKQRLETQARVMGVLP